jgi:signal transduction histidine kinase
MQTHLRHLTHQILSAQEEERKKISRELHDEIAQTLLGINVRLLTLKQAAAVNTKDLKKEIASTQRVVEKSEKTLSRYR